MVRKAFYYFTLSEVKEMQEETYKDAHGVVKGIRKTRKTTTNMTTTGSKVKESDYKQTQSIRRLGAVI